MRPPALPAALRPFVPLLVGALVVALLAGVAVGRLLPFDTAAPASGDTTDNTASGGHSHGGGADDPNDAELTGLSLSGSGFTLKPAETQFGPAGKPRPWTFTITDRRGEAVTDFATRHDKKMHLFAVRRDFTGYQHLHPVMDAASGRWSTTIAFDEPGPWRVIADFAVDEAKGETPVTLGTDVTIPGDYEPASPPEPQSKVEAGGFTVTLDFAPELGASAPALIAVERDGEPVELEPYLGASGHLVMLRRDDLGFTHVHPDSERVGERLRFWATLPSAGDYRAFFDFKVDGEVRTAAFTVRA